MPIRYLDFKAIHSRPIRRGVKVTEGSVPVTMPLRAEGDVIRVQVKRIAINGQGVERPGFCNISIMETAVSLMTGGTL